MNIPQIRAQKLGNQLPIVISLIADVLAVGMTLYTFLTIPSLIASIVMAACLVLYFWMLLRSPMPGTSALTWRTKLGQTDITLFIYAVLASIIIVTIRTANGLMDVPSMGGLSNERIAAIHMNENWSIYDKSHVRLAFQEFWFYFGCTLLLSLMAIRYVGRHWFQVLKLHPATALFALSLFFGTVLLPPYHIEATHWSSFIGPALDVANGNWPMLHIQNGYGFLYAGVIAVWIKLFWVNELSIAALVILFGIITHIVTYILIKELSKLPWLALILSNILMFGFGHFLDQIKTGVNSSIRWQFVLMLSLFFIWITLSKMGTRSILASLLLGVVFLWNPLMMVFPIAAFVGVHLYRFLISKNYQTLLPIGSLFVGMSVLVSLILLFSSGWPADGLTGIVSRVINIVLLFGNGFGNFPQVSLWSDILSITAVIAVIYLVFRRAQKGRIILRRDELFMLCSLAALAFPIGYAMGRNVGMGLGVVTWVMMPTIALIVGKIWRFVRVFHLPTWPFAVVITLALLNVNIIALAHQYINKFLNGYEQERWIWSVDCADLIQQGLNCDMSERPGLRKAVADAREPLFTFDFDDDPSSAILLAGCQSGWPIITPIDTYIYLYGNCKTQLSSSALADSTYFDIDSPNWVPSVLQHDIVLVDERKTEADPYGRFVDLLEQRLNNAGYNRQRVPKTRVVAFVRLPIGTLEPGKSEESVK